jgi:hypothetical protein
VIARGGEEDAEDRSFRSNEQFELLPWWCLRSVLPTDFFLKKIIKTFKIKFQKHKINIRKFI